MSVVIVRAIESELLSIELRPNSSYGEIAEWRREMLCCRVRSELWDD